MDFFCTSSFIEDISKLSHKKAKGSYSNITSDISDLLKDRNNCQEIIEQGNVVYVVNEEDRWVLVKLNCKNSAMKEGSKGGFRVDVMVMTQADSCTLLTVYPKKGKYAKVDLSEAEYEEIIEVYLEESAANTLTQIDIELADLAL